MSNHVRENGASESPADHDEYVVMVDGAKNVSDAVTEALVTVSDDAAPPLHHVVDLDALDSLFAPRLGGSDRDGGVVAFDYEEFRVSVDSDGVVRVVHRG